MENKPELMISEMADTIHSIQNGDIKIYTLEQMKKRWESYFSSVKYYKWDDVEEPVIEISKDGNLASVSVKKITVARFYTDSINYSDGATLFAWTSSYRKEDGKWKIYKTTSTREDYEHIDHSIYLQKGLESFDANNYQEALVSLQKAYYLKGEEFKISISYAKVLAAVGEKKKALNILIEIAQTGYKGLTGIESEKWFRELVTEAQFNEFERLLKTFETSTNNSETYSIIKEPDLIPEGIAVDEHSGSVFVSSTYKRKIIEIDKNGTIKDFAVSKQDGLFSTVGMEVDEDRRHLWVISSSAHNVLPMIDGEKERSFRSKVYQYDLDSKQLIKIFTTDIEKDFFFNDLTISKSGDVYISESMNASVYRIKAGQEKIELLYKDSWGNSFYNGLALSRNNEILYQAHSLGILRISTNTGKLLAPLRHCKEITLNHIDGLTFWNDYLIAHQTGITSSIELYQLNNPGDKILERTTLEANNVHFDQASTGEVLGNKYIYIANAQMRSGFENGKIKDLNKLKDVVIFSVPLTQETP